MSDDTPVAAPVTIEKVGRAIVARPQVKLLDSATLGALRISLDEAAGEGEGVELVVIDLSQVAIVPSIALGGLIQIAHACTARRQGLKLAGLQPQIRKVFSITRLDRVFQIAESVDDAVKP